MENIGALLLEYWRGTLDPQRQQEVEDWILASSQNRRLALKYCRLEQYLTEYSLMQEMDEEKLLRLADRITRSQDHLHRQPRKGKRWALGVSLAAILAVSVIGGWLGIRFSSGKGAETDINLRSSLGEMVQHVLPDGTRVWLNSNTTLSYPETFSYRTREVRLEGEAFFDVVPDKEHPFVVTTQDCKIKVLGTQFDVDAYPENGSDFHTTLVNGSVEMSLKVSGRKRSAVLAPGQRFTYNAENDIACVSYVDVESLTSWKTGCITFCHTSMRDVLTLIGNHFGIRFVINNAALLNDTYSGAFDRQPLEEILSTLEQVTDLHFKPLAVKDEDVYPRYIVY